MFYSNTYVKNIKINQLFFAFYYLLTKPSVTSS